MFVEVSSKKDPEGNTCKTLLSAFCTQTEKNSFGDFWVTSLHREHLHRDYLKWLYLTTILI